MQMVRTPRRASNAEPCSVCLVEIRGSGAGGVDVAEPEADAEAENDEDDDYDDEVALHFRSRTPLRCWWS